MNSSTGFGAEIPANKFYPPRIDSSKILYRQQLVENILIKSGRTKQAIVIEAQAGQGKTTLIIQYLNHIAMPYAWYQVGQEDSDPVLLLNALLVCIKGVLPDFSCPLVHKIITTGEVTAPDLPNLANLLLADLNTLLTSNFYIVFDDMHLIRDHEASLSFINYLLQTAPPKIKFIFSSREPVIHPGQYLKYNNMLLLNNDDLAMNEDEVVKLYKNIFNFQVSQHTLVNIHQAADGWAMGIIMFGHYLEANFDGGIEQQVTILKNDKQEILDYFRREIFSPLKKELQQPLLILSLLDDIPVDLAQHLTSIENIGDELLQLVERNYFVHHLDEAGQLFGFHHLFLDFLYDMALQKLEPDFIRATYKKAANYSQARGRPAQALRYYQKSEDCQAMEKLLAEVGIKFLANNQTATLASILEKVPNKILEQHAWLALFAVLARMDSEPQKILYLLDKALTIFSHQKDRQGELLAITHLISIHISTTGYCRDGEIYLERAEKMFYEVADSLSVYSTILIARSLALGFCVIYGNMTKAGQFSTLALNLAKKHNIVNFQAALMMVKGYEQIFSGHTSQIFMYLEQAEPYIHNPEVGIFNALGIRVMFFNFLFHNGDFDNYFEQRNQLVSIMGKNIFSQSIAGTFCYIWEIDIALNRGQIDEAMALTEKLLSQADNGLSPHLLSQALHFKAFILALKHKKTDALQAAEQSMKLRQLAKGNYFISLNKILTGLTYAHCGQYQDALELLTEGIADARQLPTEYLEACGTLHRASVYLQNGNDEAARRDMETGLRLMRKNSYVHFWAWIPAAIQPLLELAIKHEIESGYARKLAAERLSMALPDTGAAIPLLKIKTFGGLRLLLGNEVVLSSEDLTPAWRTVICLLISSPGLKIGQEQLQLHLWPDSTQEKSRINFDTLLSRLRKVIAKAIKPQPVKHYLKLQKGILLLDNCHIDAIDFIHNTEQGLRHTRLQEYWQAGNHFFLAHQLWQGEFVPEVTGNHLISNFRGDLFNHLQTLTFKWSKILVESSRRQEAIAIASKALQYEPTNDRLVRLLFNLHSNSPVSKTHQVLKQFETALQQEDYSSEEIAELVRDIISAPALF